MNPARALLIIFVPLAAIALILGRPSANTQTSFSETFQGYPCNGHCAQFRVGFETAESRQFTQKADCNLLSIDSRLGCLSYIHEYTVTHYDKI